MPWEPWPREDDKGLARYVTARATEWLAIEGSRFDLAEDPGGRRRVIEALYVALSGKDIRYDLEEYHPSDALQPIRTPAEVLEAPRVGTCLDLAALFCGLCLGNELLPMLIVLDGHALAAVSLTHGLRDWNGYRPEREWFAMGPLRDSAKLRTQIDQGKMLAVECTGFAHSFRLGQAGKHPYPESVGRTAEGQLPFVRALEAGRAQLDEVRRRFGFALDIAVVHYGWRIEPNNLSGVSARTQRLDQNLLHPASDFFTKPAKGLNSRGKDWGDAPNVSVFHGRSNELSTLTTWIIDDNCNLVAIFGMGGMGKTALAAKFLEGVQDRFDFVWRSLKNDILPFNDFVRDVSSSLFTTDAPQYEDWLFNYLAYHRCLLVLDNIETILRHDKLGEYLDGYEDYGKFFFRIAEGRHKSCLLLTGREQPENIEFGNKRPARSLFLKGLAKEDSKSIFASVGSFVGSEADWQVVVDQYAGNPKALMIVAAGVKEIYGGNITELIKYIERGERMFKKMDNLLNRQFDRLSDLEKDIMYWLAIAREPVTSNKLHRELLPVQAALDVFGALYSLSRRSLVETEQWSAERLESIEDNTAMLGIGSPVTFTLQPVVMDYVTERIVQEVVEQVENNSVSMITRYSMLRAKSKDYIRRTQQHLILDRIREELHKRTGSKAALEEKLSGLLEMLRVEPDQRQGYAPGNVINLMNRIGQT